MAGELVPLVMVPRYTTYAGAADFVTVGMDVTEYESAILNCWRGVVVATAGGAVKVTCQESTDQSNWTTCDNTTADTVVGENAEVTVQPTLRKRWFRLKVKVEGTNPVVTCWAVGFLVERIR